MASCKSSQGMADALLLLPDTFVYNRQWQPALMVQAGDTFQVKVKGRGHSTFAQPKHPYAVKMLGKRTLPSSCKHPISLANELGSVRSPRTYVLLANFFEHSLLRNALAMEVARQTSLSDITPRGNFVNLTVNNEWQGIYWVSERVKDMVAPTDSLLKIDVYHHAEQQSQGVAIDTLPHHLPIDTLSFVDWWLIHELCMNAEPNGPRSCYVRVVGDSVVKAGPVWDFDMAFNPVGVDDGGDLRPEKFKMAHTLPPFLQGKRICWLTVDSFYCNRSPILQPLVSGAHFRALAQRRWKELRPHFASLTSYIRRWQHVLRKGGAEADQRKWNALEPARFDAATTWDEAVEKLKYTYKQRLRAMDRMLSM